MGVVKIRTPRQIISLMERRIKRRWEQAKPARDSHSIVRMEHDLYGAYMACKNDIDWHSTSPDRFKMLDQNGKAINSIIAAIAKQRRVSRWKLSYLNLISWNDWRGRTKQQVLDILAKAKGMIE